MADSVTNVQIEDVLSSIRKLVSEEVRAQTRDGSAANRAPARPASVVPDPAPEPEAKPADDRLILTQSLRVTPPTTEEPEVEEPEAIEDEADFVHAEAEDDPQCEAEVMNLMQRVAAVAPDPDVTVEEDEPEAPEAEAAEVEDDDTATIEPETIKASFVPEVAPQPTPAAKADAAPEEETESDVIPTFLRRSGVASLKQRIADVEEAVSSSGGEWEPDVDEDSDAAPEPESSSVPWEDHFAEEDDLESLLDVDEPADEDFAEASFADDELNIDFDTIRAEVELGGADARRDAYLVEEEDEEPELAASEPVATGPRPVETAAKQPTAEEAAEWEDDLPEEEQSRPASRSYSAEPYADDQAALSADDPTLLDEDMLRDMVAEIVRQELQGALGERITRNVRKLVRREIHRALSARDIV